jgi:abortive infection bacteriophage resistance protein
MARPSKLTLEIQQRIGENIALGLTYRLAAESAGLTYKTFNSWMNEGKNSTSGKYYHFSQHIKKCNADGALKLLERLNEAVKAGDTRICLWILERRFSEDFGRRVYRKTNVVSENLNQNVEIILTDADAARKQILDNLSMVGKM